MEWAFIQESSRGEIRNGAFEAKGHGQLRFSVAVSKRLKFRQDTSFGSCSLSGKRSLSGD